MGQISVPSVDVSGAVAAGSPATAVAANPPKLVRGGTLDSIRLFASVFVVLFHFSDYAPISFPSLHPGLARGPLATDFFLILSGYVLARAYGASTVRDGLGVRDFAFKRWTRVWPAHAIVLAFLVLVTLVAAVVGYTPRHPDTFDWSQLPTQLFLLQSFGVPGGNGWNLPSWTLSSLLICYALFPVIWRAQAKLKSPYLPLVIAWAVMFACWAFATFGINDPDTTKNTINTVPLAFGLVRVFPMFLIGLGLARIIQDVRVPDKVSTAIGWIGVVAFVGLLLRHERHDLLALMATAMIIFSAGCKPVLKPSKFLKEGAEISFSIYITHIAFGTMFFGVIHALANRIEFTELHRWIFWVLGCALALVAATLFHYWVDQPIQKLIRKRLNLYQARDPAPAQNG